MTDCNILTCSLPAEAQSREQEMQGGASANFLGVIFGVSARILTLPIVFKHLGVHVGAFRTFQGAMLGSVGSLFVTQTFFGGVFGGLA